MSRENISRILGDIEIGRYAWVVRDAGDFARVHRWSVALRFHEHIKPRPFRDMANAMEWLGLPADYEFK